MSMVKCAGIFFYGHIRPRTQHRGKTPFSLNEPGHRKTRYAIRIYSMAAVAAILYIGQDLARSTTTKYKTKTDD